MVDEPQVQRLIHEGRHAEAAQLCIEGGQPARAAELLATAWKFDEAVQAASDAGLYDEAFRHALAASDRSLAARLMGPLAARPEQAARAADHAERRHRIAEAARLREAAGQLAEAAELHERAGELAEAGRCWREHGDLRRAGGAYDRRLRDEPDDAESALALGQILARFGRWEHAVRALQVAVRAPEHAQPAGTLLVAALEALGMRDAAQRQLEVLRRTRPELPTEVPSLLREVFGDERGPRAEGEALLAGRYRVRETLGAGASGRVLLADDAFYGREVAIKVLHAGSAGAAGRDALARFAREARVTASIEHPNVVRVFDYHADGPFLVMERMTGGTLEDRLAHGPLSPAVVNHVARSILRALEAVHRRGVVHRDLKPANVFFGTTGEVKLGDFGVAHLVDLGSTLTGAMMGTLAYMAPEQSRGTRAPDASTDLYALGVILYRALTGALPFPGPDFVTQHETQEPAPASSLAPWVPPEFDAWLARLLAKAPEARPRTATEILESLDTLPWADAERDAAPRLAAQVRDARPSSAPEAPGLAEGGRYLPVQGLDGGLTLARDTLLERLVVLVPCSPERQARLRDAARVSSPFVQAVWALDAERRQAVLEAPSHDPAREGPLTPREREQLAQGLSALHAVGLSHGALGRAHLARGAARVVLRLDRAPLEGAPADDLRAIDLLDRGDPPVRRFG